jgi:ABC-type nitrate/sulfonate/bicarbonate transport system substrate-binding protein
MLSNQVVAGLLAPPAHLQATQGGMHVIANLADGRTLWHMAGTLTTRREIAERPERVRNFVRAYTEALYQVRADRERALDVLMKYARIEDRPTAADTYDYLRDRFLIPPYPSPAAFEVAVQEDLAPTNPRALEVPISAYYDDRFVRDLEQGGFFRELDARYPGAR